MGCNLRDLVEPEVITLEELAGQRVGIDAYLVLHQFLASIRALGAGGDGGPLRDSKGRPVSHLMGLLARTTTLIEAGIGPVFVFDGDHHKLKDHIIDQRRARRQEAEVKHAAALEEGDAGKAQQIAQQLLELTPEMVDQCRTLLTLLGVPWMDAAAEGEGAAAVLNARGDLDAVGSQDWDTLLYGAPIMIRDLMSAGSRRRGRVIQATRVDLAKTLTTHGITRAQLVDIAIMVGTDFHPGIPRIGPKTGLKLIGQHGTMEAVAEVKGFEMPERIDEIRAIFLEHPVGDVPDLTQGRADEAGLRRFLVDDFEFSDRRVTTNLERLEGRILKAGQMSLGDFA